MAEGGREKLREFLCITCCSRSMYGNWRKLLLRRLSQELHIHHVPPGSVYIMKIHFHLVRFHFPLLIHGFYMKLNYANLLYAIPSLLMCTHGEIHLSTPLSRSPTLPPTRPSLLFRIRACQINISKQSKNVFPSLGEGKIYILHTRE